MSLFRSTYIFSFVMIILITMGVVHIYENVISIQMLHNINAQNGALASAFIFEPKVDIADYRNNILIIHHQLASVLIVLGVLYCLVQLSFTIISKGKYTILLKRYIIACSMVLIPSFAKDIYYYLSLFQFLSFNQNIILFAPFVLLLVCLLGATYNRKEQRRSS